MLANPVPGTAAQVLSAILREDPAGTPGGRATFSLVNLPDLPSLATEAIWLPQYAVLDANGEFTGMLISQGWATKGVTAVTSAYTPQPSDAVILCNATSAPFTVTLPDATQPGYSPGQRFTIVKTDTSGNAVTVNASAGQLISGASSVTLSSSAAFTSVVFDGTNSSNWWVWAASATSSGSTPTGPAGGSLSGTYPNPGLAVPVALSATSNNSLLTVTNSQANPTSSQVVVTGQTGGDKAIAVQVTGDTAVRGRMDTNGKLQWGPGNASQDTSLYRAGAGLLQTDQVFNAAQGIQAAGTYLAADNFPSGATAQTIQRGSVNATSSALTSGTLYVRAIWLPQGLTVSHLTFFTDSTAEAGGTHGWYALLDSGLVVRAVTTDQTGATVWGSTQTAVTLATNSYTTTAAGLYYAGVCVVATTPPTFSCGPSVKNGVVSTSPAICGASSTGQTTPPSTGTTMGAISANGGGFNFYAYTS